MKARELTTEEAVKLVLEELDNLGIEYYINPDTNTIETNNLQPLSLQINLEDLEGVTIFEHE